MTDRTDNTSLRILDRHRPSQRVSARHHNQVIDVVDEQRRGVQPGYQVVQARGATAEESDGVQHPTQQFGFGVVLATFSYKRQLFMQRITPTLFAIPSPAVIGSDIEYRLDAGVWPFLSPHLDRSYYSPHIANNGEAYPVGTRLPTAVAVFELWPVSVWWNRFRDQEPLEEWKYKTQWLAGKRI